MRLLRDDGLAPHWANASLVMKGIPDGEQRREMKSEITA